MQRTRKSSSILAAVVLFATLVFLFALINRPAGHPLRSSWEWSSQGQTRSISLPFTLSPSEEVEGVLSSRIAVQPGNLLTFSLREEQVTGVFLENASTSTQLFSPQGDFKARNHSFFLVPESLEAGQYELRVAVKSANTISFFLPYLTNLQSLQSRVATNEILKQNIFFVGLGMSFLLAFLLFFLGTASSRFRNAYISFSAGAFFGGVVYIDFLARNMSLPDGLSFSGIFTSRFGAIFTILSILCFATGIEAFFENRVKKAKYLLLPNLLLGFLILWNVPFSIAISLVCNGVALVFFGWKYAQRGFLFSITFWVLTLFAELLQGLFFSFPLSFLSGYGTIVLVLTLSTALIADYRKTTKKLSETLKELSAANQEMEAMNEELESSYKDLEATLSRFENLVMVTTGMIEASSDPRGEFLPDLLENSLSLIPEADYGSVSLIEGSNWHFAHAVGHDLEKLRQISFRRDFFSPPMESPRARFFDANVFLVDQVESMNDHMPPEISKSYLQAVRPTKQSALVLLRSDEEVAGYLTLDIAKGKSKQFSTESLKVLGALGSVASAFLAFRRLGKLGEEFQKEIILAMIHLMEIHDQYTRGHSEMVAQISVDISRALGFSSEELDTVYWAGLIHDIGKLLVPANILNKAARLTSEEFESIKMHPVWGYEVVQQSKHLKNIAPYIRHHHERFDGKGYPDGLKGEQIPLISRIICVADTWDAMTRDRAYRKALDRAEAREEIANNRGSQFDPGIAAVLLDLLDKQEV